MKNAELNAQRWFREAGNTLRQVEKNFAGGEYSLVCFLAEQACQKSLKAVLYFDGHRFVVIHSIAELLKQAAADHPELSSFSAQAVKLDQYHLSSRYPDAVAEPAVPSEIFVKEQAAEAVMIAQKIFEACKNVMLRS